MADKHTYYFKHDFNARNDEKIIDLMAEHGVAGYGVYWCLIESLANATGYRLQAKYKRLAYTFRCDEELIRSVIEDFELFSIDSDMFFSESLINRLDELDRIKRVRKEAGAKGGKAKALANAKEKPSKCLANAKEIPSKNLANIDLDLANSSKEKKRKEEERKGKEEKNVLLSDTGKPEIEQKVLGEFKVKGQKETWKLTEEHVNELKEAFSCIDIISECKKAKAWLSANPSKMKTSKGMKKFLFGWIERSNNSGRATFDQSNNGQTKFKSEGTRLYPEVIHEPRPVITEETKEMIDKLFNK